MNIQCTTCGTQTRSGAKFCHACGTPIATAALPSTLPLPVVETKTAPPPPFAATTAPQAAADTEAINVSTASTAYLPQTPQTYHAPPPVAMAPKKSGSGLKVVLISLAIIMIIGIGLFIGAGVYFGRKAARAVDNIAKTGLPTISNDPKGIIDESLIYPGAKRIDDESVSGSFGPWSGAVAKYTTEDDIEEVADFYRDHFKNQANLKLNESSEGKGQIVFTVAGDKGGQVITISDSKNKSGKNKPNNPDSGQTEIVIIMGKGFAIPPPPPPPHPPSAANRAAQEAERNAKEMERRAKEMADKVMKDIENATKNIEAPPPPPPPKH